jgi:hypothetical protein
MLVFLAHGNVSPWPVVAAASIMQHALIIGLAAEKKNVHQAGLTVRVCLSLSHSACLPGVE